MNADSGEEGKRKQEEGKRKSEIFSAGPSAIFP
jgi:hypothetical protein